MTALADATGLGFLRDEDVPAQPVLPGLIDADYCARARILPLSDDAGSLTAVAYTHPPPPPR
ncbi:hypothetical protein, partial [Escherichia coli]|uniref:GspE/PulE/PilB domain-containing protein n=1 Tax=Escherichia coli TaxID=562 RepID=UPI001A7ED377